MSMIENEISELDTIRLREKMVLEELDIELLCSKAKWGGPFRTRRKARGGKSRIPRKLKKALKKK